MEPQILILAAGAASRMRGADKLLEPIDGEPLLYRIAAAAVRTGVPVKVALPPDRPLRNAVLRRLPIEEVMVDDPDLGLSASLRAGLAALPPNAPVLLLLADLPEITAVDLRHMLAEWRKTPEMILRGTSADGSPGHPVCLPAWTRTELLNLSGDEGARSLLVRHAGRLRHVVLPDHHATTDLDTPEDWAKWRGRRS
ncbi:MAG: CTP--molybdopterin cytidylyltransferase [Rhodobacter sp.]|nr:CTP--molybdopterin cytidylyltransferase [Rhodobacter sp.]